jgi:hypothetical protein
LLQKSPAKEDEWMFCFLKHYTVKSIKKSAGCVGSNVMPGTTKYELVRKAVGN